MTETMSEERQTEEAIINIIHKRSGFEESVIGCWLSNYQSPPCQALHGSCKNLYVCQLLENRYTSKGDNNGIQ